jgi:hypothetical protein
VEQQRKVGTTRLDRLEELMELDRKGALPPVQRLPPVPKAPELPPSKRDQAKAVARKRTAPDPVAGVKRAPVASTARLHEPPKAPKPVEVLKEEIKQTPEPPPLEVKLSKQPQAGDEIEFVASPMSPGMPFRIYQGIITKVGDGGLANVTLEHPSGPCSLTAVKHLGEETWPTLHRWRLKEGD